MSKRKKFIITTYYHGEQVLWSESERFARRAAQAKGWWVKKIEEAPQEEKKAA